MNDNPRRHRDTIFLEDAPILSHQAHPGAQYILRVQAPQCAAHAQAGSFAHITCDPQLPMRRPLSIMRVSAQQGWVDFLYKVEGHGTRLLAQRQTGETLSILGPIGRPFDIDPQAARPLLIGGGVGIPPMIFLAEHLHRAHKNHQPLVLMGSEIPFPFQAQPSQIIVPSLPDGTIAAMPLLEDWGIASRLSSQQDYPGCYPGYVTDLARTWLQTLDDNARQQVCIYACGPHPMLAATVKLAKEFGLPSQVSLEEYMACAVGGCAGCVVQIMTDEGPAMKRVCVDGPVFAGGVVVF